MKILAVGDLVGECGLNILKQTLPKIRKEKNIDFVIVNAENVASGMGITSKAVSYTHLTLPTNSLV